MSRRATDMASIAGVAPPAIVGRPVDSSPSSRSSSSALSMVSKSPVQKRKKKAPASGGADSEPRQPRQQHRCKTGPSCCRQRQMRHHDGSQERNPRTAPPAAAVEPFPSRPATTPSPRDSNEATLSPDDTAVGLKCLLAGAVPHSATQLLLGGGPFPSDSNAVGNYYIGTFASEGRSAHTANGHARLAAARRAVPESTL